MSGLRSYALPLLGALLFHGLAVLIVMQGIKVDKDAAQVITPQVVNAELIVDAPQKNQSKPAVKKSKTPPQPAPSKRAPAKSPEPKVAPSATPATNTTEAQRSSADETIRAAEKEQRRKDREAQRRRERLAALGALADGSLQRSLDEEAQLMQAGQSLELIQSYQAQIYDLVRKNWSRPPSARNGMQARFVVELIPTGDVLSVALVDSSSNGAFDRSAEQAIRRARRFDVPQDIALFEANFRRFYFLFRPEDLLR